MMNRAKLKGDLQRLITEAPRIAPSITRFEVDRRYGRITDEALDTQNLVRWELEARSILDELAMSGLSVFKDLHEEFLRRKEASKKFHSRSILAGVYKLRRFDS